MADEYYLVRASALPEILLKVVQIKKRLESGEETSIAAAVEKAGISRSSYYKYKDAIDTLAEEKRGQEVVITVSCRNQPGMLSRILEMLYQAQMNVETIYQSVPVGGIAEISIHARFVNPGRSLGQVLEALRSIPGVTAARILEKEVSEA